ncbi:methylenetetrahydrofolate reductase [NAD(P)H] [Nonlabens antarcticus]|uniref:methylenetetrahydrofolate reductase [NAD(P)H] n=1 Tax=Nonlabens antarcticus TaxID=392714 RepID=UPI0018914262|nr:methylenetetrahydrofolate reductase [NAD(P)H] [Nonlabens antarcticus]
MKITDHIKNASSTLFSFEMIPPVKGKSIQELYDNIDPLMEFKPPFVDVTTSREEFLYLKKAGGLLEKRLTRMRPGTLGICASIQNRYQVDTVPHLLCGGFTQQETEYLLVDCQYLEIDNVMALRGDARTEEKRFECTDGGHNYAIDLVRQISEMNRGNYLHEVIEISCNVDFCIGVAGYPEKHDESPSMKTDLKRLKDKVDAGADYVVTQMFFDNQKYFEFVRLAREMGITVPIIPGIKPVAIKQHLQLLPQTFHLDIPEDLVDAVENCASNKDVRQVGVEFCIEQCRELLAHNVPVLHFYSMGKSDNIYDIAKAIF